MSGYNFTERVRRALAMAREESARLHHEYVGTEHMLLGLLRVEDGLAMEVMRSLSVSAEATRDVVLAAVRQGKGSGHDRQDLPYTSRAKHALELAMHEARSLGHGHVGTEHLLLGILAEEKGLAAQVLVNAGLTLEKARAETVRLGGGSERERSPSPPAPRPVGGRELVGVTVELRYADGTTERRECRDRLDALRFLILS